jgi:hypothetical protein
MYHHTQRSPRCFVLYAIAIALFVTSVAAWAWPPSNVWAHIVATSFGCSMILFMTAAWNHSLTIADDGDRLKVRGGPIPWPLLRPLFIEYRAIKTVKVVRLTGMEGYGFDVFSLNDQLVTLWGRDCVEIRGEQARVRLGTDDAENLAAFLKTRIP